MREAEIEEILREEVKKLGGRAYKWVSPGNSGVPDRIVIFPDRAPVFVELKADKGKLTVLQEAQVRRLRELGQQVRIVRGIGGVMEFFRDSGFTDTAQGIKDRYGGDGL